MATYCAMEPYCTPEQIAKAMLLEVYVFSYYTVFLVGNGRGGWLVENHESKSTNFYKNTHPDVDTALERAASPAKYGLKWI